jgi:hypothetical protein
MQTTQPNNPPNETGFWLGSAGVMVLVLAVMLLLFSAAYITDLDTLRRVPGILWDFTCGRPVESDIALPLLLTLSILSFVVSSMLFIARWLVKATQERAS